MVAFKFPGNTGAYNVIFLISLVYKSFHNDTISIAPILQGTAKLWTANLDVARQIAAGGPTSPWIKPREYSRALLYECSHAYTKD